MIINRKSEPQKPQPETDRGHIELQREQRAEWLDVKRNPFTYGEAVERGADIIANPSQRTARPTRQD